MTALLLSLMLLMAFMPAAAFADDAGSEEDYALSFNDGYRGDSVYYYYITANAPGEFNQGDKLTVTDNGQTREFVYKFFDFYDEDWKTLSEYGLGVFYTWAEDYHFADINMWDQIGKSFSYAYYLYKVDEEGRPLDENGQPVQYKWDAAPVAFSQLITLTALDNHIEKTVKGVLYYVYTGESNARVINADPKTVKGSLSLPRIVNINGDPYPLTRLDGGSFAGCKGLTSVRLPDTLRVIDDGSFVNTGLKSLSIPATVKTIASESTGFMTYKDPKTGLTEKKKVPGFVVYAKTDTAGEVYAYDSGLKLITEKNAKAMKPALKAKALKNRKARLTWSKKQYAKGYQIYMKKTAKGKYVKAATIKKPGKTSWTCSRLAKKFIGKKAYFKVRTYTDVGNTIYYGKWSKVRSVRIKK